MAQAMMLSCGFSGHANGSTQLKKQPSLLSQIQKIKQDYSSSHSLFSPIPTKSSSPSSSPLIRTFALFKSKAKAPPKVEKPKRKVEDGIFGTSGGIGFTKQNELFVGRVAMLGFAKRNPKNLEKDSRDSVGIELSTAQKLLSAVLAISLLFSSAATGQEDGVRIGGAAVFRRACIGCHDAGGNVIQPGATLFAGDLERNGAATEEEIYRITYSGKGRMPGFGEMCTPRGQCTFGLRLNDDEIRLLAQFVKLQAQQGWPKID